jgi:hypothetical protein
MASTGHSRRRVAEQIARLAVEHLAQLGQRAEPDRPGVAILQDRQINDRYPGPLRQFGQGHAARLQSPVKMNLDVMVGYGGCPLVRP